MKNYSLLSVGALLAMLLSGCATTDYHANHAAQLHSENQALSELDSWKINAKLGIRTASEAQSIQLLWQQQDEKYQLKLNGPLGFGSAYIEGDSNQAKIQKNNRSLAASPQQLAMQLTGIPLPLTALSWWVKGLLSPDYPATNINRTQTGKLEDFQQAGWHISILDYAKTDQYWMPKKIAGRQGDISFKLVISRWDFSNNKAAE